MNLKKLQLLVFSLFFFSCISFAQTTSHRTILENQINEHLLDNQTNDQIHTSNSLLDNDYSLRAIRVEDWNSDLSTWEDKDSIEYTYENELLIESVTKKYENETWSDYRRVTYEYDANGNQTLYLSQRFENEEWVNGQRTIQEFDENSSRTLYLSQNWTGSEWETSLFNGHYQSSYEYDSEGDVTYRFTQDRDEFDTEWINDRQTFFEYDDDKNLIQFITQNLEDGNWVNSAKTIDEFDTNNHRVRRVQEVWTNETWVNSRQFLYEYNANGMRTLYNSQRWVEAAWVNSAEFAYEFNSNNDLISYLSKFWNLEENGWDNSLYLVVEYDNENNIAFDVLQQWQNSEWVNLERIFYYYDLISSTPHLNASKLVINISPNPAHDNMTIDLKSPASQNGNLKIYNTLGQLVHSEKLEKGLETKTVKVNNLTAGTYSLQITVGNQQYTQLIYIK